MGKVSNSQTQFDLMETNTERRFMMLDKKEIDPGFEITELFINDNDLYILSEKALFKCLIVSFNKIAK